MGIQLTSPTNSLLIDLFITVNLPFMGYRKKYHICDSKIFFRESEYYISNLLVNNNNFHVTSAIIYHIVGGYGFIVFVSIFVNVTIPPVV